MTALSLEDVLADIRKLPSLPAVVNELIRALDNELTEIEQLAEGIAKDQSLAARALRVANSPFYGVQHKVASIHDAIVILGFRAVGSLVMAASVTNYFPTPSGGVFDPVTYWRHGIGVAICARALAREVDLDAEAAFSAGLLHDIGVLMLLTTRPRPYAAVFERRRERDCGLADAEQEVLGFDHAQAGAALTARWRLPEAIVRAVALHHAPEPGRDAVATATLADVVYVANILAHALDLAGDPDAQVPPLDAAVWRRIGLREQRLMALLPDIEREHESYCALLAA